MDVDLSSSSENLLLRLEELQKTKQLNIELLLEQQALQRQNLLNEKSRLLSNLHGNADLNKLFPMEEYETLMNISQESEYPYTPTPQSETSHNQINPTINDRSNNNQNISSKSLIDEVPATAKFRDFDKLLESELKNEPINTNVSNTGRSTTRAYLKRGEGMHRFGMSKNDIGRSRSKMPWLKKKCKVKRTQSERNVEKSIEVQKPKRKLEFIPNDSNDVKTWANILNNDLRTSEQNYISDTSVIMSPSFAKTSLRREVAEQDMFDLIENKLADSSFSSTNSFYAKIFGNRSNLLKLNPIPGDEYDRNSNHDSHSNETIESSHSHERVNEPANSDSEDTTVSSDTEETCKVNTLVPTSTPNQVNVLYGKNKFEINPKKSKVVKIVISSDDSQSTPKVTVERPNVDYEESTTLTDNEIEAENTLMDHRGNVTKQCVSKAEMFEIRLTELEREIEIFESKNASLDEMRQKLELEREIFFKEKASAESKLNEDKVINEYYLTEEREKLKKQKMLYDRHVREMKGQMTRKENEENTMLSREVAHLKEQIAARDAKFGAIQSKLRNQIKSLESENKSLKDERDRLQRENRKLSNSNARTRRLTNINLLANINRSISQMTVDKSDEVEDVFPTKRISAESLSDLRTKQTQPKKQKPIVLKHKMHARTKSAPNLSVESRYAKYFSEKDEIQNCKERDDGYGLGSDSESDHSMQSNNSNQSNTNKRTHAEPNHINPIVNEPIELDTLRSKNIQDIYTPNSSKRTDVEVKTCIKEHSSKVENPPYKLKQTASELSNPHLKTEKVREDGTVETSYANGNHKIASADGSYSKLTFYNGDVKEVYYNEGTIKYLHKNRKIYHTSYKDGSEIIQFPDGYIERRYPDGSIQTHCSNGTVRWIKPGSYEEYRFPDGTLVSVNADGEQTLRFPNGQVEIHTSEFKKREFPDGTIKIAYTDGVIETRYANGRIRIKDKLGNLIMDTINQLGNA